MSKLFGFNIKKSVEDQKIDTLESFAPPSNDDGAMVVAAGGAYGTYVDLDGAIKTEADLISKYREMSLTSEIDAAIDDIVNESIVCQDGDNSVDINLDELTSLDEQIKLTIKSEFENILSLLEFKDRAYEIFRRYYIDGRLYYHVIIDNENILDGIKELRYIDPRKIKKVKELSKKKNKQTSDILQSKTAEYYVYSDKGLNSRQTSYNYSSQSSTALKIAEGSILYITSGLTDSSEKMVLSHLHKAIRPLNQMRNLEDAVIIYRISRAAERRIFYIDVGNLPKGKAEQYLRDMMARHKNKLVYNAESGDIQDTRKFMTMLEDYWFPRREGGKGTEVTTLSAAQNLGEMEDVKYFQQKVYKALNVPVTRLEPEMSFNLGRATEITRDEIKFSLFIDRLRLKFSNIFTKVLEKQLILKNIITPEDWKYIERKIRYKYKTNNYFSELKDSEILGERLNRMEQLKSYVGRYYSNDEVRRKVLRQTDDDIMRNDEKIAEEQQNPQFEFPLDSNLFNMEMQEKQMEMQQQQNEAEQQAAQQESAQNNQNDGSWDFEDSTSTKKSRSK